MFLKNKKKELNIMSVVLGPYLFVFFLCFLFSVGRERGLGVDKVYLVMKYFFFFLKKSLSFLKLFLNFAEA